MRQRTSVQTREVPAEDKRDAKASLREVDRLLASQVR